ncbi:MAG: hypothetical protein V4615_05795 [Bacteroidota bacterium]
MIAPEETHYTTERLKLVDELKSQGISDDILYAVAQVPLHLFIRRESNWHFIHRPLYSALQVFALRVKPGDVILEKGTGSGYLSALLCVLGAKVYTIEYNPLLHQRAVKLFGQLNYPIHCFTKDEYGFIDFAPYDKIISQLEEKPDILARRLKIGGFAVYTNGTKLMRIIRFEENSYPEEMLMDMKVWEEEG